MDPQHLFIFLIWAVRTGRKKIMSIAKIQLRFEPHRKLVIQIIAAHFQAGAVKIYWLRMYLFITLCGSTGLLRLIFLIRFGLLDTWFLFLTFGSKFTRLAPKWQFSSSNFNMSNFSMSSWQHLCWTSKKGLSWNRTKNYSPKLKKNAIMLW